MAFHVLEKPFNRLISQGGNVDWFDFWLTAITLIPQKQNSTTGGENCASRSRQAALNGLSGQVA